MARRLAIAIALAMGIAFICAQDSHALLAAHIGCSNCHNLHGSPSMSGSLLNAPSSEALCLACHGPGGTSIYLVDVHTNKTGSSYPAFTATCTTCHNSHDNYTNADGSKNIKLVGDDFYDGVQNQLPVVINTTNSGIRNVVFVSRGTDAGGIVENSFADADFDANGYYDGVCEVCHTQTKYHRNNSSGDHTHKTGRTCTVCHPHSDSFVPAGGACTDCHNASVGTAPDAFRNVVGAGGDFANFTSRHVFGGTATNWDCIVCHAEGSTTSSGANISTTAAHNDAGKTIAMRNVDQVKNPEEAGAAMANAVLNSGSWTVNWWEWPRPSATPTNADHTNMDRFCMSCHDANGASGIAVNATDNGLDLPPTLANALKPFNSTDAIDAGTGGGSSTPGATLTTWFGTQAACEAKGFTWSGGNCLDRRSKLVDIKGMFNTANPSHHAVLGQRYTSNTGTGYCYEPTITKSPTCSGAGGSWIGIAGTNRCVDLAATTTALCSAKGGNWTWMLGWSSAAWANKTLKNGTNLQTVRETATLHCSDCHTVDQNAHGGANRFMLTVSTIDGSCFTCHNQTTYDGTANTGESRFNHTTDSNVWSSGATGGSRLDATAAPGANVGMCLLCHGGAHYDGYGAIHGIPSTSTDVRTSQNPRYRFIGGGTMSYYYAGGDWQSLNTGGTCYFINPDPQPWSYCSHHGAGTSGGSNSQYRKPITY